MAHVLVLGGGFGGLAAANELKRILPANDEVTLVASSTTFYMGFAKLWDLGRTRPLEDGTASLAGLASRGVRFVEAEIRSIDAEQRGVETTAGALDADALIVALGAIDSPVHVAMLAGENAHDLYSAAELPAMRQSLAQVGSGRVLVAILGAPYKCPPAPYEAAFVAMDVLRQRGVEVGVTASTPQPMTLPSAGPDASQFVAAQLAERGATVLTKHVVTAVDAGAGAVTYEDGASIDYQVLLGVPAAAAPPVVKDSALAGSKGGFVEPDVRTLRTAFDRVYAVGDCAVFPSPGGQLPKAGVFAAAQGEVAARNVAADLHGGSGATFDGHGYCFLELPGRKVAFVEGNFLADPPDVRLTEPSEEQFARKQAYERDRLASWLR